MANFRDVDLDIQVACLYEWECYESVELECCINCYMRTEMECFRSDWNVICVNLMFSV